ncbi:hypothetical protein ACFWGN_11850 [Oerskovia sp. NPDC060338]|uniref:hypothetical protein n=1 Tax=Oerskovia sp. NPDC060338 TaxID=3347100 RepID=UPI0036489223
MTTTASAPIETFTAHWCPQDEKIVEPVVVYECSRCGERSDERRCPTDNIFAARVESPGCPECFDDVEEIEAVTDHDGETVRVEDYDPQGASLVERDAEARAQASAAQAERVAEKTRELDGRAVTKAWSEVRPGDQILVPSNIGSLPPDELGVYAVEVAGPGALGVEPGSVIALLDRYGLRVEVHAPDDQARVMIEPMDPQNPELSPVSERITVGPAVVHGSSGHRHIMLRLGKGERTTYGRAPVAVLYGSSSPTSNGMGNLGAFIDPREARAYADAARVAAEHLALDGGRRDYDDDVSTEVSDEAYMTANLSRWVRFALGTDMDQNTTQIILEQEKGRGSYSACIKDKAAMLALVDLAEQAATWLEEQVGVRA